MLGPKLVAAEGLAQDKEAAAQQLSLAKAKRELTLDALDQQRSLASALEAATAGAGACAPCAGSSLDRAPLPHAAGPCSEHVTSMSSGDSVTHRLHAQRRMTRLM